MSVILEAVDVILGRIDDVVKHVVTFCSDRDIRLDVEYHHDSPDRRIRLTLRIEDEETLNHLKQMKIVDPNRAEDYAFLYYGLGTIDNLLQLQKELTEIERCYRGREANLREDTADRTVEAQAE